MRTRLPESRARANPAITMDAPPALLQFIASLMAILALAGVARWLRLGAAPRLGDENAARIAAQEAVAGFDPVAIAVDRQGRGALLRDASGQVMVLRQHGAHFAGRLLAPTATARRDGDMLIVDTADRRFGVARLEVADADAWANVIAQLREK